MTKRSHLVTLTTLALMAFVAAGCAADVGDATGALRLSRANYWVGTVQSSTVRDGSLPPGADFRMDLYGPRPDGTYTGTVAQLAIPDWFVVGTRWPDGMVSLDGEHVSGDCVDTAVAGQISCELLVPGGRISVLMDEFEPVFGVGVPTNPPGESSRCPAPYFKACGPECCLMEQGCSPQSGCYDIPGPTTGGDGEDEPTTETAD